MALKDQPVQLYTAAGQPAQHRGSQALICNVRGKQDVAALAWHPTLPLLAVAWLDGGQPCEIDATRLANASEVQAESKTAACCKLCLSQLAVQVLRAKRLCMKGWAGNAVAVGWASSTFQLLNDGGT